MKRTIVILFTVLFLVQQVNARLQLDSAKAAIVCDARSGRILYEKNADSMLKPASLTKMMTAYIVSGKVRDGELAWTERVVISSNSAQLAKDWRLANVLMKEGESYSVDELFKAMMIYSSNSAAVSLAEHISGTENEFAKLMNLRAGERGIKDAYFFDATGLSNTKIEGLYDDFSGGNRVPARAAAQIAYRLLKDFPEILEITSKPELSFSYADGSSVRLPSWNSMLPGRGAFYLGVDGIKTGHTAEAGYCFTATAEKNGMRVISIVLGCPTRNDSFAETKKILDFAFENYELKDILPEKVTLEIDIVNGKKAKLMVSAGPGLLKITPKTYEPGQITGELYSVFVNGVQGAPVTAPAEKGKAVGFMTVLFGENNGSYLFLRDNVLEKAVLYSDETVKKTGIFRGMINYMQNKYAK